MCSSDLHLPLPSYVKVTNPANGRSVIVRINDRGPFHDNRLIDLSYAAAYKLRLVEQGSGEVIVEAIDTRPKSPEQMPPVQAAINAAPTPSASPSPVQTAAPDSGIYVQVGALDRKSTRLNSSHEDLSRMPYH